MFSPAPMTFTSGRTERGEPLGYAYWLVSVQKGRSDETRQRHRDLARTAVLKLEEVLREGHQTGRPAPVRSLGGHLRDRRRALAHGGVGRSHGAGGRVQRQAEKIKCWYEKLKRVFFWMRICAKLEALMDEWHIEGVRLAKAMIAMEWGQATGAQGVQHAGQGDRPRGRYIKEVAYGIECAYHPARPILPARVCADPGSIIKIGSLSAKEVDEARDEGQAEAEARWDDAAGRPALAFDEHGLPELAEADAVGFNWATFEARIDEKAKEAQMRLLEEGLVPAPVPAPFPFLSSSALSPPPPAPGVLGSGALAPAPSPRPLPTYGERPAPSASVSDAPRRPADAARRHRTVFVQQAGAIPASPPVTVDVEGGMFEMELEPAPSQASPPRARPGLAAAVPASSRWPVPPSQSKWSTTP
eukprot:tig00000114_g6018.t1